MAAVGGRASYRKDVSCNSAFRCLAVPAGFASTASMCLETQHVDSTLCHYAKCHIPRPGTFRESRRVLAFHWPHLCNLERPPVSLLSAELCPTARVLASPVVSTCPVSSYET